MEMLYQYYWMAAVRRGDKFSLVDGRELTVLSPGILNKDAGPDFFYARLSIDGKTWAGNIEVHTKASDWLRHGHSSDKAYDNVVLHVVAIDDTRIHDNHGHEIAQLVITPSIKFLNSMKEMELNPSYIRCSAKLPCIDNIYINDWLASLTRMRLQAKGERITHILERFHGDWQQACFVALAIALGFNLNSSPFEVLTSSIPLKILSHHSDNLFQLEALLFGKAGMLTEPSAVADDYRSALQREYRFLATKYGFNELSGCQWKYARTRPANFPHRRIAFLAALCHDGFSLFSTILDAKGDLDAIYRIFDKQLSPYWQTHYTFSGNAPATTLKGNGLTRTSIDLICINMIAPLYYAYATSTGKEEYLTAAYDLIEELPAENNHITRSWASYGIRPSNAAQSQALIHLYKLYCTDAKCAECRFFSKIINEDL
jgi:hypothetical protein